MSAPQPGTPLPWNMNPGDETKIMAVHLTIARADCGGLSGIRVNTAEANAAYIVHACNNYPKAQALADALRALRNEALVNLAGGRGDLIDDASAALAAWDAKP